MADLTFADSHNMVAYLEKSEDNADFAEIVDFLNASHIRYALTVSPTIYVSYIKQFWSTAKTKIVNNKTQIRAKVDGKTIVITESSVRRDLYFNDEDGIACLTNTKIFENLQLMGYGNLSDKLTFYKSYFAPQWKYLIHTILQCLSSKSTAWNEFGTNIASAVICLAKKQKFNFSKLVFDDETMHEEMGDSVERAATTATSLDADQGSGNINRTQSTAIPNDPFPQGIGSSGSPRRQDTMGDKPAQTRFERLSKQSNEPPFLRLKKRVKKLESKKKSRTPQLKRRLFKVRIKSSAKKSLGDQEDASKQGRNEIDQDEGILWFQEDLETQGRYGHDTGVNTTSTSITTASINITTAEPVTTASAPITSAGVFVSTAEPSTPPPTTTTFIEDEDLIIAQTLIKMRSVKSKEKSKEKGVSSETATRLAKGVIVKEASETATRPTVPPPQIDPKDKGKAIMQEPEKPVKVKGKDQIEYDADVA
ncbi:hypothetical protein Tco_0626077 [Tanacetum coccineum]|uniref:Xylulose kinase-1 n=1 Tax=Tanacetum coccineum TaxID=301880 RepID=A0ABQ4WIL7_9ASTR